MQIRIRFLRPDGKETEYYASQKPELTAYGVYFRLTPDSASIIPWHRVLSVMGPHDWIAAQLKGVGGAAYGVNPD